MIHVDRARVSPPSEFLSAAVGGLERLREFNRMPQEYRDQRGYPFEEHIQSLAKHALREVFHGKCAFCESPLNYVSDGDVAAFRPRAGARDLDGSFDPEHYWWLAYDWENLYFSCSNCNLSKRDLFPVGGFRAQPEDRGLLLDAEGPNLIDPCRENPRGDFTYLVDVEFGQIHMVGSGVRGKDTIDIFNLNRTDLLTFRFSQLQGVRTAIAAAVSYVDRGVEMEEDVRQSLCEILEHATDDRAPFAGAARFLVNEPLQGELLGLLRMTMKDSPFLESMERTHLPEPANRKERTEDVQSVWPVSIQIRNFRTIQNLTLTLPSVETGTSGQRPWLMLVGPNGVGKSTVLEALALALATPELREAIQPNAPHWLFRGRFRADHAEWGSIQVSFNVGNPVYLYFSRRSRRFYATGKAPDHLRVAGYGPHRIAPHGEGGRVAAERIFIQGLFRPGELLGNWERWLADTTRWGDTEFGIIAKTFRDLLQLEIDASIVRNEGEIAIDLFRVRTSVRDLSSGYRALLGLAADIAMNLSTETVNLSAAQGVVLVDEIETHLHPSWKIQVVGLLRKLFPHVVFLATTHDPLCLRGLEPGEVYRMNRNPGANRVYAEQMDVPDGASIDAILTGGWFELDGVYDATTMRDLRKYQDLIMRPRLDLGDREEIARLEVSLRHRLGHFAEGSLEKLAMRAAIQLVEEETEALKAQHQLQRMKPAEFQTALVKMMRESADWSKA